MGDFFDQDLTSFPKPDAIFIGGHGSRLTELLFRLDEIITSGTIVVINTVQKISEEQFTSIGNRLHWNLSDKIDIQLDIHNPISLLRAEKV